MSFTDFFQPQQAPPPQHVPEPAGFDLIRDLLMRKAFGLQADPYTGASPAGFSTGLINAPAFPGGGNVPGYPTSTTSGPTPGGGPGGWGPGAGRQTRIVNRPVGLPPGSRVPINAGGSPSSSGQMSGMAGGGLQSAGGSGDLGSLLAAMLGGAQGRSYDAHHGHHQPQPSQPLPPPGQTSFQQQHGGPLGLGESWAQRLGMTGANVQTQYGAMHPNAAPRLMQGNWQGGGGGIGGSHTFMTYDSQGNMVPIAEQNGLQGQAGKLWGRPNDPQAAAAYDHYMRLSAGGHGAAGFGGFRGGSPAPMPPTQPPNSTEGRWPSRLPGNGRQAPLPPPTRGPRTTPTR